MRRASYYDPAGKEVVSGAPLSDGGFNLVGSSYKWNLDQIY
ncbi:MAG: hypothetical protein QNJ54_36155 [Prochloraceae cyanobacterium]|nr:hypothetical protein [Prochloraceae cyanobacterium]